MNITTEQLKMLADEQGMVSVNSDINGLVDNGKRYTQGQPLHMHIVPLRAHLRTGMVTLQDSQLATLKIGNTDQNKMINAAEVQK